MHVSDYIDSEVGLDSPKPISLLSFNGHDKLKLFLKISFGINRCLLLMKLELLKCWPCLAPLALYLDPIFGVRVINFDILIS